MRRVIIESPFRATGKATVEDHIAYARACLRDSLLRGEAPFASHLLYTQPGVLDDAIPEERDLGLDAGLVWGYGADLVAVYTDFGISQGMQCGIDHAKNRDTPIAYRSLDGKVRQIRI